MWFQFCWVSIFGLRDGVRLSLSLSLFLRSLSSSSYFALVFLPLSPFCYRLIAFFIRSEAECGKRNCRVEITQTPSHRSTTWHLFCFFFFSLFFFFGCPFGIFFSFELKSL
ncbi:hypothetical protein RchiOBHm_Chr2g0157911 [Rosa chinensis]|uniref:Uncharacterized protein n=1 Tax=Rosa chinensis TaxID=74649 RepID=A0A2P6S1W2_ROSCH|nr:hypothetical protein RchiOBHm_Chr2g0157911 [Rosa chinensis]